VHWQIQPAQVMTGKHMILRTFLTTVDVAESLTTDSHVYVVTRKRKERKKERRKVPKVGNLTFENQLSSCL
jgi:hypothetical protein